ncbi:hypothetical protein CFC21_036540, partial [Triticum aestivum]
AAAVAAALR